MGLLGTDHLAGKLLEHDRSFLHEAEQLVVVAEAFALVEQTDERYFESELYRLKGELTLQSSATHQGLEVEEEAEGCFRHAIAIARRQQAKSWELRAATSLAKLWKQRDKQDAAHRLLSGIYGWFTEGFATKDLQDAKALLDKLV